uniref:Dynein light chain Tctex-type 1 n=1 Tax=Oryzias sinensis TaxID=183150 RepID=A0A8C7X1K2_9TELE
MTESRRREAESDPEPAVLFNTDENSALVKECIEGVIGGADYDHSKVNQWTAGIVENSLTHLVKQGRAFKFIVNCAIMQKSGAGLHTANSCYWDTTTDGSCTVRWENRTMYCVVSVFAVAL